jgi:hypothetical protein
MAKGAKETTKAVVAAVIIAAALFLMLNAKFHWVNLGFLGGKQNPAEPRDINVVAIDINTGDVFYVLKRKDEKFPLKNPDTKQPTLWPAYVCYKEKIIFPAEPGRMIARCPYCGSMEVGGAMMDQKDFEVRMPE